MLSKLEPEQSRQTQTDATERITSAAFAGCYNKEIKITYLLWSVYLSACLYG